MKTKQGILLAAVTVALGVIFLPTLRESAFNSAPEAKITQTAALPLPETAKSLSRATALQIEQELRLDSLAELEADTDNWLMDDDEVLTTPIKVASPMLDEPVDVATVTTGVRADITTEASSPTAPEVVAVSDLAPAPTVKAPKIATDALEGAAWVVQVGSFSEPQNAVNLLHQLKTQQFSAFTKTVRTDSGKVTRVYVGPMVKRAEIETTRQAIKQKLQLAGVIVSYQPAQLNQTEFS